jgi:hypothetical protein
MSGAVKSCMLNTMIIRLHWQPQLKLAVLPACQPLLFLTCHVIFDLSSVYYLQRMHVEFCRPDEAFTGRN